MATKRDREKKEHRYADARERAQKHSEGFTPTSLKLPDNCKLFRFSKKGICRLDFLPYVVGKGNPYADEGVLHYERTYYTHSIPSLSGLRRYVCSAHTFGKKCAVCDALAKMKKAGEIDHDSFKEMKQKDRQLFNVIDLDNQKDGVQVLEFNWFQLGKLIDGKVEAKERYKNFFHLKGGMTLEIDIEQASFQGSSTFKPAGIEFEPRETYDDAILDKVYCLDDLPKEMPYDELMEIFMQGGVKAQTTDDDDDDDDDDEEDDKPAKGSSSKMSSKKKDDDDDDDDSDDDDEDDEPVKNSSSKKKDDDDDSDDDEEDTDDDDDDEEEESEDDDDDTDDDDSDDDDEEEEEEVKKPSSRKKK